MRLLGTGYLVILAACGALTAVAPASADSSTPEGPPPNRQPRANHVPTNRLPGSTGASGPVSFSSGSKPPTNPLPAKSARSSSVPPNKVPVVHARPSAVNPPQYVNWGYPGMPGRPGNETGGQPGKPSESPWDDSGVIEESMARDGGWLARPHIQTGAIGGGLAQDPIDFSARQSPEA